MRQFILAVALAGLGGILPAAAQRAPIPLPKPLAQAPREPLARSMRLACPPLAGQVFEPNGQPLAGATLLIKGTSQVYVANSEGQFQITETVYQGQTLTVQAAGYRTQEVSLADCTLPRLVLEKQPTARIKRSGKRAGQVTRLGHRRTDMR